MYASPILLVGLGAFASQALAYSSTVIDTTVVTIISCGPEVENCPGKTIAPAAEVTKTSTFCPPSAPSTTTAGIEIPAIVAPPANFPVVLNTSRTITPSSNLSTNAAPVSTPTAVPSSGVVPASYSNSTITAPSLLSSEASIITATGVPTSPTTLTSVVVVPATTPGSGGGGGNTTPSKPTSASAGDRMVVPGIMLGVLAFGAYILG